MPPHFLTNFEIRRYYQNEPRFNGFYSRDDLLKKIKDGAYITKPYEYSDVGTHWIALFSRNNVLSEIMLMFCFVCNKW